MRRSGVAILLGALSLACCGPPPRPPPPDFAIPPGPPAQPRAAPAVETSPPFFPPGPNPEVQLFLPGRPEDVGRGPAPVPRPGAPGPFYAAPPNLGPVTGYGPGGMALPPGAPPNPPYPAGGLTGTR